MRLAPLALALLAASPAAAADAPAPPAALEPLLKRADAAYAVRDQPGRLEEVEAALAEAARAAPGDYQVLWRQARVLFWRADDNAIPREEKSRLGKACWEVADQATAARPDGVEGWFHAASGVGTYALGIGVLTALTQGIEGKYRERLSRAEALDKAYEQGAISTAWGRFWYELPWPKYDEKKAEARLREALAMNPRNVRALVYLAELLRKEDREPEARKVLEQAAALEPGSYDAPEERRWRARARELLAPRN